MPYNKQRADKTAHAEFIENPDISSLVEQSAYLKEPSPESARQLGDGFTAAFEYEGEIPKFVHASDGSFYEASLDERYPTTKVGYVKVSSLILDVEKYLSLGTGGEVSRRYIDPMEKSSLEKNVRALSMALPSANLRYNNADSVANGFRQRLYEDFINPKTKLPNSGTLLDSLFRLATSAGGNHGTRTDTSRVIFVHKCPNCEYQPNDNGHGMPGFSIDEKIGPVACAECGHTIYPTDTLRLHETITDHGGLSGGLSRIMNVAEYMVLAHTILDCLRGDYLSSLSDVCFFVDGPLAFFGQPAWLHRPMQNLIYLANRELTKYNRPPMIMLGMQKQGVLSDHSRMISKYLPRNSFRFIDDEYRNKYISPVAHDKNFGNETYFGQDFIYHTAKGNVFVVGIPYTFQDKNSPSFKTEKALVKNYPDLPKVLKMIRIFESDLYEGSLVPIIVAHRNASISRLPGGKVLDIASRINFNTKNK